MLASRHTAAGDDPAETLEDVSLPTHDADERALLDLLVTVEPPQRGDTLDGIYEIDRVLGSGGMGTVYLARDTQLERDVAIKVIHADRIADPGVVARFLAEARTMARVHHPNVVTIHTYGSRRGQPYLVMEHVPGTNLSQWRRERGTATPAEAVVVLEALCRGVQAIHDAGAIHRDLKPGNVLIGPAQRVAVTDFGLARSVVTDEPLTRTTITGTPAYLAPEIARHDPLVPELATRIDIYALGVMAFELLTGQLPFTVPGLPALLHHHAFEPPPRPSEVAPALSPAFDAPLLQALAKAPAERTPGAEALRRGLLDALEAATAVPARPLRVLVVDDDRGALMAVHELLRMSFPGADVVAVADPSSALALAEREPPDLVITDLHMPHGGGVALTAALRRAPATRSVPIVVVTAYGGGSDWRELKALGADRFLVKPVDIDTLVSVVRSLTARSG